MAKGKYQYWLTPEGITLLTGWARDGLTDAQIAHNMGCSRSTLNVWRNAHADISDALKKGRAVVDYEVENDLVNACHAGNVTAMIFYLKNRRADRWKDRPEDRTKNDNSLMQELVTLNRSSAPPLDAQEGGPK